MATHLSVRLAWHDRGWDGHVCDAPHLNSSCIVHQHIRDARDDRKERAAKETHLSDLQNWLPPCSRDTGAYAAKGYRITHRDPLDFRGLPPVAEDIPAYSCCPSPYRWMREENFQTVCESEHLNISGPPEAKEAGWVFEPDRQRELLKHFWDKLERKRSLAFYYVNQGNPLDEEAARILVGIGRIVDIGPQIYFGTKKGYEDQYPVWSRRITQDFPAQGVRLPYQEYLRKGHSTDRIICPIPRGALMDFSYVGEHVTDDVALTVVERMIQSVERVQADGLVAGDWGGQLTWLNGVLAELWTGRGPYPGLGSVLEYLGCSQGTAYHRFVLSPLVGKREDPLEHVLAILSGKVKPAKGDPYARGLTKASEKWLALRSRQALLKTLARFELSVDQVERIANPDSRSASGIVATEAQVVANPYVLSESDWGSRDSEPIGLETIDHGMWPEGDAALFAPEDRAEHDDGRRSRAVSLAVLRDAASKGDSLLTLPALIKAVSEWFPEGRSCRLDQELVIARAEFLAELLWTGFDLDPPLVAIKSLAAHERYIADLVERRASKTNSSNVSDADWKKTLESFFGAPVGKRGHAAIAEKVVALQTLSTRRFSVLTGGAGTGKTSVLKVFLDSLDRAEGKKPVLLLAPTGKARVRLSTKAGRNAMTIHQFLLKQGWLDPALFHLKADSSVEAFKAATVVIDECSMIPTDLFGTLLRALDNGPLRRLILVGDPNQLPPIGPGRPFIDIIEWLKEKKPDCIAPLLVCMRTSEDGDTAEGESVALAVADGYRAEGVAPADDELLSNIAKGLPQGDLRVAFWKDHDELLRQLKSQMSAEVGIGEHDYKTFNASLGVDDEQWSRSEAWQILSPTRTQPFGTDDLNRIIQREYKGGLIVNAQRKGPRPFGEFEIVWTDKVIQIKNRKASAWPKERGMDYVANGEIGLVKGTTKSAKGDYFDVVFSTQDGVSYRYFRNQTDENVELAYAITVHKAQGSDFDTVFVIVPQQATTLCRELIYTALTRFRKRLVLLLERDIQPLLRLRSPAASATRLRNTQMFRVALRPDDVKRPYPEALIHRTRSGVAVRSKSEVVVANELQSLGISYEYEKPLFSPTDDRDFRLPDFTVSFEGDTFYWEHLGMLNVPSYREAWERKLLWYQANGYSTALITSQDGANGSIDATEIQRTAKSRILGQ